MSVNRRHVDTTGKGKKTAVGDFTAPVYFASGAKVNANTVKLPPANSCLQG